MSSTHGSTSAARPVAGSPFGDSIQTEARPSALARGTAAGAPDVSGPKRKIALLVPLSRPGQTAEIARGLKQAGELALFAFQNPQLELVVKDTAGTAEGARAAADAALAAGAQIIIGPLFASSVTAVATVARPRGIPVIAFSNDESVAAPGTYLLSFQPRQEIGRIIDYAVQSGKQTYAGLIADDAYGKVLTTAFRQAVAQRGGRIAALETYPRGANGMLEKAQKLFEQVAGITGDDDTTATQPSAPLVDAVFVPGDGATLPTLGPIMTYAKLDARQVMLIGNGGWDYRGVNRIKAFHGGLFAAPDPRQFDAFAAKYGRTFNAAPPRIASFAYDGVAIAATLAARAPSQPFTADRITAPAGFDGIDGPVRFLPSGLAERGLSVLEVTANGTRVVSPAPTRFGAGANTQSAVNALQSTGNQPLSAPASAGQLTSVFQPSSQQ
ncbi:MAG: penicillin-binding protein activator [Pseudomonadota bacterium]